MVLQQPYRLSHHFLCEIDDLRIDDVLCYLLFYSPVMFFRELAFPDPFCSTRTRSRVIVQNPLPLSRYPGIHSIGYRPWPWIPASLPG